MHVNVYKMHINLSVLIDNNYNVHVYNVTYKAYTRVHNYMLCYLSILSQQTSCVRISDEQPSCRNISKPIIKGRKIYWINFLTTIMLIVSLQEPATTT